MLDFHNTFLCCGFLCARLISPYLVSILCLSFRLPRRGLPRPILTTTGYHACVYIPVITPELPRSTTHVHRVITPAIVVRILQFTFHRISRHLFFSILHHHRAPHVPTYSTPQASNPEPYELSSLVVVVHQGRGPLTLVRKFS